MKAPLERALIVVVPVVSLLTFGLGLGVGAGSPVLGARVSVGAPPIGRVGLGLQIATLVEDRHLRDVAPHETIHVAASHRGDRASWDGTTNDEGVAETWLDVSDVRAGDHVTVTITGRAGEVLAEGMFVVPDPPKDAWREGGALRAAHETGQPNLEVFLREGRLVPRATQTVFVHAGAADLHVEAVTEPGLTMVTPFAKASANGWTEARVEADFLTAAWTLHAPPVAPDTEERTWFGALPVSPGAAAVTLPTTLPEETPTALDFEVPPASPRLYVEVDDAHGRDFAAALPVTVEAGRGHVHTELPRLARGLYWLVSSPAADGAETMKGATMAWPFFVGEHERSPAEPEGVTLARQTFPRLSRSLVLDGLVAKRSARVARRKAGLRIALGSLGVAAWLETLLILRAARASQKRMAKFTKAADEAGASAEGAGAPKSFGPSVVVLLLATLLGIGLLAALLRVH